MQSMISACWKNHPAHSSKDLVLDAGEEVCAFLRLSVSGGAGSTVGFLQSECYVTDSGKVNRTDSVHGYLKGYADHYTRMRFISPIGFARSGI